MKKISLLYALLPLTLLAACGETRTVDLDNQSDVSGMQQVMQLEYRDWTKTADAMTASLLKSGAFMRVKNPVVAMGPMTNDTMQRFDTDILVKKIRTTLVNSGQVQVATNFSGEDTTSDAMRATRANNEYAADTFAQKGTLVAPNLSLSGKMMQRNIQLQSGWFSSTDTRVEYYLQMTLTDLKTGLSVWEDEQPIVKEGANAPTW